MKESEITRKSEFSCIDYEVQKIKIEQENGRLEIHYSASATSSTKLADVYSPNTTEH